MRVFFFFTFFMLKNQKNQLKGIWHENKLQNGQWVYPNGNFYEGKFEHNRPIGEGNIFFYFEGIYYILGIWNLN